MAEVPSPPTVTVSVPASTATPGVLPVPPNVTIFPVIGPADISGLAFIKRGVSSYAVRSSVTDDPLRVVVWIGSVAPTIDATYALNNVDVWWNTSV